MKKTLNNNDGQTIEINNLNWSLNSLAVFLCASEYKKKKQKLFIFIHICVLIFRFDVYFAYMMFLFKLIPFFFFVFVLLFRFNLSLVENSMNFTSTFIATTTTITKNHLLHEIILPKTKNFPLAFYFHFYLYPYRHIRNKCNQYTFILIHFILIYRQANQASNSFFRMCNKILDVIMMVFDEPIWCFIVFICV